MPIVSGGGATGGSRPFIEDTETGIVVNRAGGFVAEWEEFDLLEPGAGYGMVTVTAADDDGLGWDGSFGIEPSLEVQMSTDGVSWVPYYDSSTTANPLTTVARVDPTNPVLVGQQLGYVVLIPRAVRFRAVIIDSNSGVLYTGDASPTFTYTFFYAAS